MQKSIVRACAFASALGLASMTMLGVASAAPYQHCYNFKMPKGYSPLPSYSGQLCVNKMVFCTCDAPGVQPVTAKQPKCVYPIIPKHEVQPPPGMH